MHKKQLQGPAKIIRQTLQETDESHLQPSHLKSISQSLYIILSSSDNKSVSHWIMLDYFFHV